MESEIKEVVTPMVDRRTWEEFRDSGMLWWINMILHTFGWAIAYDFKDDKIESVYPARVKFRGFNEDNNTNGYMKISRYMKENSEQLYREAKE